MISEFLAFLPLSDCLISPKLIDPCLEAMEPFETDTVLRSSIEASQIGIGAAHEQRKGINVQLSCKSHALPWR